MQPRLTTHQSLMGTVTGFLRRASKNEFRLGTLVLVVVVAALVATAVVYKFPTGQKTVTFESVDASAVREGQDVRVAGVSVGKVTKVDLQQDTVLVQAQIDGTTFVGADTRIEVRMLTPVGGYFVTVIPLGDVDLGVNVIPKDRVTMPYSIAEVLQAAPNVTDNVDGRTIQANIDQLADGLQHNSASVGTLVTGLDSVATVMSKQRDQVRTTLDLAEEFLNTFNGNREFIFSMIQRVEIVLATYYTYRDGFNETYKLLGDVLIRLIPLEEFHMNHKEETLAAVNEARDTFQGFQQSINPVIDQLSGLRNQLEALLTPDGVRELGGGKILASDICIPIPGRTC